MEKRVYHDILIVLKEAIDILKKREEKDIVELRDLSNHTIHNASIFQDENSLSVAILIYTVYKIIKGPPSIDNTSYNKILSQIKRIHSTLQSNKIGQYKVSLKNIFVELSKINKKISLYINEIVEIAKIKKGVKLFEHGLSLRKVANLLNISEWDLRKQVGERKLPYLEKPTNKLLIQRLKIVRSLFK